MDVVNVLHMNAGNRECSYANNSTLQKTVILKARKVLEDTIKDFGTHGFPECFKLADLGCSSGPNTLLLVANIVDNVHALCEQTNLKAPDEFQVFLNDLPNNDFNAVFKMITSCYTKLKIERGDQRSVPEKLLESNKENIYMAKASPSGVCEAYFDQFKGDFTTFLHMRSQEMIPNGRMVLTLIGRSIADPTSRYCCYIYGLLAKSLQDMLAEGLLHEEDINSFNIPIYHPCTDELKAIIESEGSFSLDRLETFEVKWDTRDENEIIKSEDTSGKFIAKTIRAVLEPLLVSHFGNTLMDKLFEKYAMHVTEHLSREETNYFNIVISLTRKSK